jgi:hypothetical protein
MTPLSIGSASQVYGDASQCEILRHWVDHPGLAEVSRTLRALVQSLADEIEDEFWRTTLGPLRRLAFAFCSAPLPFAHAAAFIGVDWAKLNGQVRRCQQLFPDAHEALASLAQKLERLSAESGTPLTVPLEELLSKCGELSVIIRNPRMNQAVAAFFAENANLQGAKVVSAMQLRGAHLCNALVAIGPCGWHPEYVFSAPRAPAIHVISFRWIRDNWRPGPIFLNHSGTNGTDTRNHRIGTSPRIGDDTSHEPHSITDLHPIELLPPLPAFARGGFPGMGPQSGGGDETVPARLCHLSGNRAVFVAADDGTTSLVIDTSEPGHTAVRRTPADELEPGQYLLLRTSGGGDFIAPLADRILGDLAAQRRAEQAEWKAQLAAVAVERFGDISRRELASGVCSELHSRGLSQARPANVHYWMSPKCIHPRKEEDFAAIMTFAGLAPRSEALWAAMGDIARAHTRAGHLIRQMLLQKIAESSLEPLERDGEMEFDLGQNDGGTLSAFQITGIVSEECEVPADRIGVLLDTED